MQELEIENATAHAELAKLQKAVAEDSDLGGKGEKGGKAAKKVLG